MLSVPGGYRIRRARLEDLTQILQLERRVWRELAASKDEIRKRFLQFPQGMRVALTGQLVVGCCQAALFDRVPEPADLDECFPLEHAATGRHLFLFGLTIHPLFRRRGIAGTLVGHQLKTAQKRGCLSVHTIANRESRQLFEKLGFLPVQALPELFREFGELMREPFLMEKLLPDSVII